MKKITLLIVMLLCCAVYAQEETLKLDYYNNKIEITYKRSDINNFYVYVTRVDSDGAGATERIIIKDSASETAFSTAVIKAIKSVANDADHKISITNGVEISLNNDGLNHDTAVSSISALDEENFKNFLKANLAHIKEGKKLDAYISDVDSVNYKPVFTDSDIFRFKKVNDEIKVFEGETELEIVVTTEEDLINTFYSNYSNDTDFIKKNLFTEKDFNTASNEEVNQEKVIEYYKKIYGKSDYEFLRNIQGGTKAYEVSIKTNNDQKAFNLKFCNLATSNCEGMGKLMYSIDFDYFEQSIGTFLKEKFSEISIPEADYKLMYEDIKKYNENAIKEVVAKQFQDTLASLVKKIENLEPQYAGLLKLNESVRLYKVPLYKDPFGINKSTLKIPNTNEAEANSVLFIPEYATIRFFNNKAKEVVVVGKIEGKETEFVVINVQHSIPLRAFNNSKQFVPVSPNDDDAEGYYLNYNDLFQYYPSESSYSYSARNNEYRIEAGKSVKIEQRRLSDFFTAVIFSDFLGLSNDNANSLLQAEGRVKVPLWISNWRKFSAFSAIRADLNVSIYNGFDDTSRFITPINAENGVVDQELETLEINNFDFIKYNNVNAGIGVDIFTMELKGLSTEWSFGYGLRYYRAGTRYLINDDEGDIIKQYQLNALTHELNTTIEIRPQINFGADVNIAYNWINSRGSIENIPIAYDINKIEDKSVLKLYLNLYSKLDPSSSSDGVYARLGGYYHLGEKDFFPQILVGYATNLTSFVNTFKKK